MTATQEIDMKVKEIIKEMKMVGLWKSDTPAWVKDFKQNSIKSEQDFAEWLQFIYLPNLLSGNRQLKEGNYFIVPQARLFFGIDEKKQNLFRLLIELDSLVV